MKVLMSVVGILGSVLPLWAADLYVGSNTAGVTTTISSGTNSYSNTIIGYSTNASNNTLVLSGSNTVYTNGGSNFLSGGYLFEVGVSGGFNKLIITDGADLIAASSSGSTKFHIGSNSISSNNQVIISGTGSYLTNDGTIYVGYSGSANAMVVSNGGSISGNALSIGQQATSLNNILLITGSNSSLTSSGGISIGNNSVSNNSVVISNGASVNVIKSAVTIHGTNDSLMLIGTNSVLNLSNASSISVADGAIFTIADGAILNGGTNGTISIYSHSSLGGATLNIGRYSTNDAAGTIIGTTTITLAGIQGTGMASINFNQSDSTTIASAITGSNGIINQLGSGTTILSGSNSALAKTYINSGVLEYANTNAFYAGSNAYWTATNLIVSSNGTAAFAVGGSNAFTAANIAVIAAIGSSNGGFQSGSYLGLDSTGTNFSYGSAIANPNGGSNSMGLNIIGTGTVTLTGTSTYSGGTTISAGSVAFTRSTAFGSGTVSLSKGALLNYAGIGPLTFTNGITADFGTCTIGNSSGFLLTLGGTLTKRSSILKFYGGSYNVSGKITGSDDSSDLVLSNASVMLSNVGNDYNGPTKLLAGSSLTAAVVNALPKTSILTMGGDGESSSITNSFDLNGNSQTIGGLYSLGGGYEQILNSSGTAAILTLGGNSSFGGSIKGNLNLSLTNAAITLSGNNSYTGSTTLNGTSLNLTNSGSLSGTTNLIIGSGSVLSLGGNNQVNTNAALNLNGGSLSLGAAATASRATAQTFTNLTLTANSVIDFGNLSGTSALTFNSVALGSYNLTVLDWSGTNQWGSMSLGDPTHLSVTTGLLDSGSLSQISFYGTAGEFLGIGAFSGHEIVPVPEPNVMIIEGLLFLGLLAYRFRLWV